MKADSRVYTMGLGVPDPKGVFGTTLGLKEEFGSQRVLDMPTSENGITGVAIGSALVGMRPVMVHQRLDFALLALDQIVNQAANWHYMYGGKTSVPIVIRLIIGRGWGQGPQHSQSLHSWFSHVPGLKVVAPSTPHDAKGLLISSIEDNNPVIFIEHRWLHNISGHVPLERYRVPIGAARIVRSGTSMTIVAISYMTLESSRAAETLACQGIDAEVVDIRSLRPLDDELIVQSVRKTGRLLVVDSSWSSASSGADIVARVVEREFSSLKAAPRRIHLPDCPSPSTPALAACFYPRAVDIVKVVRQMLGYEVGFSHGDSSVSHDETVGIPLDVPDPAFAGPF